MTKPTTSILTALSVASLSLAACGSPAGPDKFDVAACKGLKHTIAQLPNGTVGNAGTTRWRS